MCAVRIVSGHWYGERALDYRAAWDLQREIHADRVAGRVDDTVLFMEHPPVYTAGKRTRAHEHPAAHGSAQIVDVDRGGKITFHGPGQLVGYPICQLPSTIYVVDYVRRLEEALIRTVTELGVACGRVRGRSGVWLAGDGPGYDRRPERKIAQIGIRVSGGVTMHGFSLNCNVDLGWFDTFVPCGIDDAAVTSLSHELGREITATQAAATLQPHLVELLEWRDYTPSGFIADHVTAGVPETQSGR